MGALDNVQSFVLFLMASLRMILRIMMFEIILTVCMLVGRNMRH